MAVTQMDATTAQKPESPSRDSRASTTSFLTATTLIYATGAGITAAAGTRLALQLLLITVFTYYPWQTLTP